MVMFYMYFSLNKAIYLSVRHDTLNRLRRRASIGPALGQRVVFAGSVKTIQTRVIIKPILLFVLLLNLFYTVNWLITVQFLLLYIIFVNAKRKYILYL